jgi:hypothetical protein
VLRSLECIGGPWDGKRVEYVGPEYRVPLSSSLANYDVEDEPLALSADRRWRVGIYRKLYPVKEGLPDTSRPAYVWEPTAEVRSLYP